MDAVSESLSYYRHSVETLNDIHAIGIILSKAGKELEKCTKKDFESEYGR